MPSRINALFTPILSGLVKSRLDDPPNPRSDPLRISADIGFPEAEHRPALPAQVPILLSVTRYVSGHFGEPVGGVGACSELGSSLLPIFAVPEVAITEDGYSRPRKDQIWSAWDPSYIFPVAETLLPQRTSEQSLRLRIPLAARAARSSSSTRRSRFQASITRASILTLRRRFLPHRHSSEPFQRNTHFSPCLEEVSTQSPANAGTAWKRPGGSSTIRPRGWSVSCSKMQSQSPRASSGIQRRLVAIVSTG